MIHIIMVESEVTPDTLNGEFARRTVGGVDESALQHVVIDPAEWVQGLLNEIQNKVESSRQRMDRVALEEIERVDPDLSAVVGLTPQERRINWIKERPDYKTRAQRDAEDRAGRGELVE